MADRPTQPEDPTEPIQVPPRPPLPADAPGAAPQAEPVAEPEATTLPLPVVTPPTAAYPQQQYASQPTGRQDAAPAASAPKRRGRRGLAAALTTVLIVAVLAVAAVIGWFAGNAWAKDKVIAEVTDQTRAALGMSDDAEVDVAVDEPMLPQLLSGKLSQLTVTVPQAPLADTTGALTVHASDVPTSGDGPIGDADATVSLRPDAITKLVGGFDDTVPGSLHVKDGDVTVELDPSQFLSGVSFALTLKPSAKGGDLVLTPVRFTVAGYDMSAETIRARFGSLADGILADRTVCVADRFPAGLKLSEITVGADAVDASFTVDPQLLSDPALQKPGTCG